MNRRCPLVTRKAAQPIELGKAGALDALNALCQDNSATVNSSSTKELLAYESGAVQTRVLQALETCLRKYPFKTETLDEDGNKALVRASAEIEAVFGRELWTMRLRGENLELYNGMPGEAEWELFELQKTGHFDFYVAVDSMPLTEDGIFSCELIDFESKEVLDASAVPINTWDLKGDTGVDLRRYVYQHASKMEIVHVARVVDGESVSLDAELGAD